MAIHDLALTRGLERSQIRHAVDHAEATMAIGNAPTMILILGRDAEGVLIEASCVIRNEDVLVVHAQSARPDYLPLYDLALTQPGSGGDQIVSFEVGDGLWGRSVDGLELTEDLVQELNARAEAGHDEATLRIRMRRGRAAPLSAGEQVVRLELPEPLFVAAAQLADDQGVSLTELTRQAIDHRLAQVSAR